MPFGAEGTEVMLDPESGTGGYTLLADSLLPLVHDPDTEAGREELNLTSLEGDVLDGLSVARFRVRPGEDASCLNLYQAKDPEDPGANSRLRGERPVCFWELVGG